jgi:hypothetical protein
MIRGDGARGAFLRGGNIAWKDLPRTAVKPTPRGLEPEEMQKKMDYILGRLRRLSVGESLSLSELAKAFGYATVRAHHTEAIENLLRAGKIRSYYNPLKKSKVFVAVVEL